MRPGKVADNGTVGDIVLELESAGAETEHDQDDGQAREGSPDISSIDEAAELLQAITHHPFTLGVGDNRPRPILLTAYETAVRRPST
jgi:hypothetical protein